MPTELPPTPPDTSRLKAARYRNRRWICYVMIALGVLIVGYFEIAKPVLTDDPILQPIMTTALTRLVGAGVFLSVLIYEGYRVLNPFLRPFLKSLLFILPPLAVVINNLPILSMIWGDAYLVHTQPAHLAWFSLECLAIGLFEELAFRGVVLLMLAERRRKTRADLFRSIILSSAVFGIVHLVNLLTGASPGAVIQQIGYSFLIGAMCSVVLFKTANIWLCVLLHAIFDFCGMLVPTLGAGRWWDTPTIIFTVLLALAVTAYMLAAFWRLKPGALDRIYEN